MARGMAGGVVKPGRTSSTWDDFSQVSGNPIGRFEHAILCINHTHYHQVRMNWWMCSGSERGALAPPIVTKGRADESPPPNQKKDNLDPDKYRNSCSPLVAL